VIKFLIVGAAIALLLWLVFGRSRRSRGARRESAPPPSPGAESMVTCAHCGVHLPASEALRLGERAYCSAAHRDAGPQG
jgi:uncharacterized protein